MKHILRSHRRKIQVRICAVRRFYQWLWLLCYIIHNFWTGCLFPVYPQMDFSSCLSHFFTADICSCSARGCAKMRVPVFVIFTHLAACTPHISACIPLHVCAWAPMCDICWTGHAKSLCVAASSQGSLFSAHAHLWQITLKCCNIVTLSTGRLCSWWHSQNNPAWLG